MHYSTVLFKLLDLEEECIKNPVFCAAAVLMIRRTQPTRYDTTL